MDIPNIERLDDYNKIKGTTTATDLFKHNYGINTKNFSKFNHRNVKKPNNKIRIMTWNVRYFTNVHNEPTFDKIVNIIKILSPDVLGLTEVTMGDNLFYRYTDLKNPDIIHALKDDYDLISMCNVSPSWYAPFFGNMIFIKKEIKNILCKAFGYDYNIVDNTTNKCFFNQRMYTLEFPKESEGNYYKDRFGKILEETIPYQKNTKETRCFIKISLGPYDLIVTQLEVSDRDSRLKQFDEIMKKCQRDTLIMGDFNIINMKIPKNTHEFMQIVKVNEGAATDYNDLKKTYELVDSFDISNKSNDPDVQYSTWTNIIVDHILLKGNGWINIKDIAEYNSFYYFDDATDHLPLILDYYDPILSTYITKNLDQIDYNIYKNINRDFTIYPITEIYQASTRFYNVQPLPAYDWFSNGKIYSKRNFIDPYYTGNSQLAFGGAGIYFGITQNKAIDYLNSLIDKTDKNNKNASRYKFSYLKYKKIKLGLLYTFKLDNSKLNNQRTVVMIHNLGEQTDSKIFDSENDIVTSYFNFNKKIPGKVGKFTYRANDIVILEKIDLIFVYGDYKRFDYENEIQFYMQKSIDYIKHIAYSTDYDITLNGYNINIDPNKIIKENIYNDTYDKDSYPNKQIILYKYNIYNLF